MGNLVFVGTMRSLLVLLIAVLTAGRALPVLVEDNTAFRRAQSEDEMLYIPSGTALAFMSFGYTNVMADLLWFKTIGYFGKHYSTDRNYPWLEHMCSLVTSLDERAAAAYQFCANMLAWEAKAPESAVRVLDKAVVELPESWQFRYLRGFVRSYFLSRKEEAKEDFIAAAKLPNAPALVKRLAARAIAQQDTPADAIEFLDDLLRLESDPNARAALIDRQKEVRMTADLAALDTAISIYRQRFGHSPGALADLEKAGITGPIGKDPFGGHYTLDPSSGAAGTTTKRKLVVKR